MDQPRSQPGPTPAPSPEPAHPTGTVAIVFTDIQGSTSLWEKLGDRFAPVLELHNRLMREALEEHRGYEVKTVGDAFMIAFADPLDAVRFSIDALESFSATAWPASVGDLLVRVGVHTGEPIVEVDPRTGRVDYFGPMVNCSARVESAAHGGQILIGRSTCERIRDRLALIRGGVELADLGDHRLKGIDSPERIFQVISPRLPVRDFPPIATLTSLPTNLPYQISSFVGREQEISELSALLLDEGTRLVTLSGPGGTGKTRLSLRLGNVLLEHFPGGVWVANLARARTIEDIASGAAQALGMQLTGGGGGGGGGGVEGPERLVANVLEHRKPLLMILDNFEQVVQHAPATVGLWMSRAPKTKFLVTSQSLLGLAGEREHRLGALSVPPRAGEGRLLDQDKAASAGSYDSVRLFVERAREASPGFALTAQNAPDVMTLCAELDGIPLAIELAAARIRIMTPRQMVERLAQRFQLLRSSRRDLPERHQTLQAAIEWSYELLSDWEKACFQQACVFRGGFSLESAEAVIDLAAFPDAPFPLDAVQMLREKSFLTSRESPFGVRLHMFRSVREFGEARWPPPPELQVRHAQCYASYARQWEGLRVGPRMLEALDRLEQKKDNILAAIERMITLGRLSQAGELALAVAGVLLVRGVGRQRRQPLEAVLAAMGGGAAASATTSPSSGAPTAPAPPPAGEASVAPALRARLLSALSRAEESVGDYQASERLAREAVARAEASGDELAIAEAVTILAEARRVTGALDETLALHDRAEALYEAQGDALGVARNLLSRTNILISRGLADAALACLDRAEAINRGRHNIPGIIANVSARGRLRRQKGDLPGAIACFGEAERLCREIGDGGTCARVIGNLANALQAAGEVERALAAHAQAEALFSDLGDRVNAARVEGNRGSALVRRGALPEALACFEHAIGVMRELGVSRSVGAFGMGRAEVLRALGRHAEAAAGAQEVIAIFQRHRMFFTADSFFAHQTLALSLAALAAGGARRAARVALQIGGSLRLHESPPPDPFPVDLAALSRLAESGLDRSGSSAP